MSNSEGEDTHESVDVAREMVGESTEAQAEARIQKSRARMQELRTRVTRRLNDARQRPAGAGPEAER